MNRLTTPCTYLVLPKTTLPITLDDLYIIADNLYSSHKLEIVKESGALRVTFPFTISVINLNNRFGDLADHLDLQSIAAHTKLEDVKRFIELKSRFNINNPERCQPKPFGPPIKRKRTSTPYVKKAAYNVAMASEEDED